MKLRVVLLVLVSLGCARGQTSRETSTHRLRELQWDTYLDKVQGAWMGKMIGVTFGQPWEFQYLNTPIGFDITDWPLSPTRMKAYRARAENKPEQEDWDPDYPRIRQPKDCHPAQVHHGFGEGASEFWCPR